MSIIDTPSNTEKKIACLKDKGVSTVIRYYNFSNSSAFRDKRLELPEAEALAANGIQIAVVFQQRQNQAGDFSELKGFAAGRTAFRHGQHNIGQPAGSGIYFSVDFDASTSEVNNKIIPYFEGVKRAFTEESGGGDPEYRIGVYGSGRVASLLRQRGLIDLTWLAMSRGFAGTKQALQAGEYNLAQVPPDARLCGLGVDFNDPNPDGRDFGAFTIDVDVVVPTPVPVPLATNGNLHRVIARAGLRLREGPGSEFEIIGGLSFGQVVSVASITNGFAAVDVERDGQLDGFASTAFLEPVSGNS